MVLVTASAFSQAGINVGAGLLVSVIYRWLPPAPSSFLCHNQKGNPDSQCPHPQRFWCQNPGAGRIQGVLLEIGPMTTNRGHGHSQVAVAVRDQLDKI
eukprot:SM000166S02469  [mRNA]  locus=s166:120711:121532:+ [translate_table: standard]